MKTNQYQNIKMWRTTLNNLRQIYALTGEKMVEIMDRLVREEINKLKQTHVEDDPQKQEVTHRRQRLDNEPSMGVA